MVISRRDSSGYRSHKDNRSHRSVLGSRATRSRYMCLESRERSTSEIASEGGGEEGEGESLKRKRKKREERECIDDERDEARLWHVAE